MSRYSFRLVSLGCAKNLVDSEGLAGQLVRAGWRMIGDGPADLVVVNTCGFVEDAAQESVDTLLAEIAAKKAGRARWLAAVGCLPQKYREELAKAMPEIDLVLGVGDMGRLPHLAAGLPRRKKQVARFADPETVYRESENRLLSTPPFRAYLKIAEGCSNRCAYCIIGRLRGPYRSRPSQAILTEAAALAERGVKELSLVAQDLTLYGHDLSPRTSLVKLLRSLDRVAGIRWIRLLYAHPARVDESLARALASCRQVVPYLDVPFQHISDRMLQRMGRPQTRVGSQAVVDRLRRWIPDIAIRTTFLVGHPGETAADFRELLAFVKENRFAHVGVFAWSPEEGTPSYEQSDWVDAETRAERAARLMRAQQAVSRQLWREWRGREVEVLIEETLHKHSGRAYSHVGRVAQQAPEVDGAIYVRAPAEESCGPGQLVRARVTRSDAYDLFADLIL